MERLTVIQNIHLKYKVGTTNKTKHKTVRKNGFTEHLCLSKGSVEQVVDDHLVKMCISSMLDTHSHHVQLCILVNSKRDY